MAWTVPIRMLTDARTSTEGKFRLTVRATAGEVVVTASAPPTSESRCSMTDRTWFSRYLLTACRP